MLAAILKFFTEAISIESKIEKAEARAVIRHLRNLFFYPDKSLQFIDRLIETDGTASEAIEGIREIFDSTESDVKESVRFLTSNSVVSNLHIPNSVQTAIRSTVLAKFEIRKIYADLWDKVNFYPSDGPGIAAAAKTAKEKIGKFNDQVNAIEKTIAGTGAD